MSEMTDEELLEYMTYRLKLAKRRLVYWSGRPSFLGFGFSPCGTRDHSTEYEMALDDCHCLAHQIGKLCGKNPVVRDIKREVAEAWNEMNEAIVKGMRP